MEIIDSEFQPVKDKFYFFMSVKAYCWLIGALTALNIILIYIEMRRDSIQRLHNDLVSSLLLPLVILPILSSVLAIFIALFPYKVNKYKQKYIIVAGFLLLIFNTLVFLLFGLAYLIHLYNQSH